MLYAIWYYLYNLKNMKNIHGGVLLLVLKATFIHGCFFRKFNISYPLIRTRTCAYQGVRNISFSENFAYIINGWFLRHSSYHPLPPLWVCKLYQVYIAHCCIFSNSNRINQLKKKTKRMFCFLELKFLADILRDFGVVCEFHFL